jgi:hypothetical protein
MNRMESFISIKRYTQVANVYIMIIHVHTLINFNNTVIKRIMSDHLHMAARLNNKFHTQKS